MFFSENNRLSKPHFDWPLLIASYMLAIYGVLAITIANYDPTLGATVHCRTGHVGQQWPPPAAVGCGKHGGCRHRDDHQI